MQVIHSPADLRQALGSRRRVALVPTMGNLHDGHLSLVRIARERADFVVASIFVNPLQFAPHEDFATYPRTFERDRELLEATGCDLLFAPADRDVYPEAQGFTVQPPPELSGILEGQVRPGFFTGVCTVVLKFFNMVQPAVAVFGKKDYQQLLVIRGMVRQLRLPVEVVAAETVRDAGGLALSSRNGYLDDARRAQAAQLHAALRSLAAGVAGGRSDWAALEQEALESLRSCGWEPDYVAIRQRDQLRAPAPGDALVVLAAARLAGTRLIDNVELATP
jgi:pantoate--beta-alanine ligase